MDIMPDKHFYTIGDVSRITGTKPHILRYWESQFKLLRPARRYSGHRKYTQTDLDLINKIRYLIIDRKFTLAGAKKEIMRQWTQKTKDTATPLQGTSKRTPESAALHLIEIKRDIDDCLQLLNSTSHQQELVGI